MQILRALYVWGRRILDFFTGLPKMFRTRPTFSGSFIQYWFCQDWDPARWVQEFQMLQKIGINEIILQNIVDTKGHYAVYPTQMKGYSSHKINMVETALTVAASCGMKVRIGLGFNNDWWTIDTHDQAWLKQEADVNQVIATEIIMMYGDHQALSGWYIPYEYNPLMALSPDQQTYLNGFFKEIGETLKSNSSQSIMVAPFYNARLSGPVTLALWSNTIHHVFKNTGIDILALQDSIGAGFNSLDDLDEIYEATQKACEELGLILYAVTETFEEGEGEFQAALQGRINEQLSKVSPYVRGLVAFSINHYQNGNDPNQVKGYEDYSRYYLAHPN